MAPVWAQANAAVAATKNTVAENEKAVLAANLEPIALRNQPDTFKISSR
jgi:hypothetical protein